jgi:hydroxylamine reductase (hybrid-cluster protein)
VRKAPSTGLPPFRHSFLRCPSISTANIKRHRLHLENAVFAASIPDDALVLDAGSEDAPYKKLFLHDRYESADFELVDKAYAAPTYVCDAQHIPVEDDRFDFIVFNQR